VLKKQLQPFVRQVVEGNHHTLPTSTGFQVKSPSLVYITRLKVSRWRF
jgi:hypothetical protein